MSEWKFPRRQIDLDREEAAALRRFERFILVLCLAFAALLLHWAVSDIIRCGWSARDPKFQKAECQKRWRSHGEESNPVHDPDRGDWVQ